MKRLLLMLAIGVLAIFLIAFCDAVSAQDQCNTPSNNPNASAKQKCVDQVNLEDMRVKRGEVNGDTMTLRVEDQAKTQGRSEIYGNNVDINVSGLNQSEEVVVNANDININEGNITNNSNNIKSNYYAINDNRQSIKNIEGAITSNYYGVQSNRQSIDDLRGDLNNLRSNLSAGVASSIAIAQHQFNPSYRGGQVSLSGGYYRGENALSFAMGVPIVRDRVFFSASIAADTGSYGASGGAGVTFLLQ